MKYLLIEKEIPGAEWKGKEKILENEALHVYELIKQEIIKEIYFDEHKNAVLIVESSSLEALQETIKTFPLVQSNLISFEIRQLKPYTGFDRIIKQTR